MTCIRWDSTLVYYELAKIHRSYPTEGCDGWKRETISVWLRCTPTAWKDVVGALQQMGENTLAEKIEQKYITASNLHQPVTISISLFTLCAHVQKDVKQLVFSIYQSVSHQNHSNICFT